MNLDENIAEIPKSNEVISRFKLWMQSGINSSSNKPEEEEIRMSGALCIGNLARSDETCLILVKDHGVGISLLSLLKLEVDWLRMQGGVRDEKSSGVKVLHAVVGALKNLSLTVDNRPILGSQKAIERIVSLFEFEELRPAFYPCIGVLKNLCAGDNPANAYRIITGLEPNAKFKSLAELPTTTPNPLSPLGRLITLVWNSTGDSQTGIRSEGARVIVNLIRAINRAQGKRLDLFLVFWRLYLYLF